MHSYMQTMRRHGYLDSFESSKRFCYASFSFGTNDNPNTPILILLHLNVPENAYWLRISFSIQETHMQVMF